MLGHVGFSYVGLSYLVMLFIPNLIWMKNQPVDYDNTQEARPLLWTERIGQIGCFGSVLFFNDYNVIAISIWSFWLLGSLVMMFLYEICWIRYFISERTQKTFYRSLGWIPVPLASLPVAAFLLLGVYGKVIWLIASAIVLGIGHIGLHVRHEKNNKISR